jgi:deoxyribose-phosphate aldolase
MMADKDMARRAIELLDLTSLNEDDTEAAIERLCSRARTPLGDVAAVCVYPRFVPAARRLLRGSMVRVATVANFPAGGADIDRAVSETRAAIADGADEVDVVLPYQALLAGDRATPLTLVAACKLACGVDARLKVILETGALATPERIIEAARLAIQGDADFLKTSTGKLHPGATLPAARVMLDAIAEARRAGRQVGFKAAGGIRTAQQAAEYLSLADQIMGEGWATRATFRFGASALLDDLLRMVGGAKPTDPRGTY